MSAPKLSPIDQRLAAQFHLRQIEALVRLEKIGDAIDAIGGVAFERWMEIIGGGKELPLVRRSARMLFERALGNMTEFTHDKFADLASWSHLSAVKALGKSIPRHWFKSVSPELVALGLEDEGKPLRPLTSRKVRIPGDTTGPLAAQDLDIDVFTEPIADRQRRMSDEQWQRVLNEVVFPPPSALDIERMIQSPNPNTGFPWQARFENLSRKITDIDRMSGELVTGYAAGENLQQLKKRALPLVQGIQSSAKRIVRTEGLRIAEHVQRQAWEGLGDMMVGAQLLAVLDVNTRPHHAARNGTVFYKNPGPGQQGMNKLPFTPDEPNCRCWSTPVLKPPKELENDPAVQAAFANASGAGIPDPATYDQWFSRVDPGRRKMAVGVRRYNEMTSILSNQREPQWTDFIDPQGQLLPIEQMKSETPLERMIRKEEVDRSIHQRKVQMQQMFRTGFLGPQTTFVPPPSLPPELLPPPRPTPVATPIIPVRPQPQIVQPAPLPIQITPPVPAPTIPAALPQPQQPAPITGQASTLSVQAGIEAAVVRENATRLIKTHEQLTVYSPDGKELVDLKGTKAEVKFDDATAKLMKDAVVTHNHPGGWDMPDGSFGRKGRSLSLPDIRVAVVNEVAEMRAVSPGYIHRIVVNKPPNQLGIEYWLTTVKGEYAKANRSVRQHFERRIKKAATIEEGRKIVEEAEFNHAHLVNEKLANKLGWTYERREHP